jgi:hypothetical protein
MIYGREKKYEVTRIDKILYPVSVAYMYTPPHHATRPIGGTAQLLGSPGTVRSDARAREWTGLIVTPPAVWSEAPWTLVTRPTMWSRAFPSPDDNLKSCDPFPLPEAQAEDPTDPLTPFPSEQTAIHALLGSHQLQASHVVPGSRGSPKLPRRVPRHSHPLLF